MNTGSANGQGWGVIDLPRNQSACWESTANPEQGRPTDAERGNKRREENLSLTLTARLLLYKLQAVIKLSFSSTCT